MHHQVDNSSQSSPNGPSTETTPLIGNGDCSTGLGEEVTESWSSDARRIASSAIPLMVAGLLQQSIGLATIYQEILISLPMSLAIMTANVTGYAVFQGMAPALETLCAQAYGSGNLQLVGLHFQQMVLFLWTLTIPIGIIWYNADKILGEIIPDRATAELAGAYLRVLLWGAPGYAAFEAGKRYIQAQGIFHATTYILVFIAPLNCVMSWLFVVKLEMGFIGAPAATGAFQGWSIMISLALPGFVMMEAEFIAFEAMTLAALHLSGRQLAAQSILSPLLAATLQLPLAVSIAASTIIAGFIGSGLPLQAARFAHVGAFAAGLVGVLHSDLMGFLGVPIASFLTSEKGVIREVGRVLPIIAMFQLFDSLATSFNGFLRGRGRQSYGSMMCIVSAFRFQWQLAGLWSGVAKLFNYWHLSLFRNPWDAAVQASRKRQTKALV
ncbi:mate-domain-containing protein [Stachybotrys elegans]|uniref:Mate-domain-containing protein n=1 Tax=Stachybotrys elegans TaxID=80388 RepID=A0A8K0WKI4_9HYPO|nr:mate-domain-containing protein [Stachybotrys elegans]